MPCPLPPLPEQGSVWKTHLFLRAGIALALLLSAGTLVFLFAAPLRELVAQISPGCVFHQYTGIKCPGCGGTRAALALLRGDWEGVLRLNAFWVPTFFILAQELFIRLFCAPPFRATRYYRAIYLPSLRLYAGSVVIWFIARNIFDC